VVSLVLTCLVDISSECRAGGPREGNCYPTESVTGWGKAGVFAYRIKNVANLSPQW